jgi:PAS domain S-box-containing protein
MKEEKEKFQQENQELRERLCEVEETLEAMHKREANAIAVKGSKGDQLHSIVNSEHPYQVFIESMGEAALILSKEGIILYANAGFFKMIGYPAASVIGTSILDFVQEGSKSYFMNHLQKRGGKKSEFNFVTKEKQILTLSHSVFIGEWEGSENLCLLATDISELKRAQRFIEASEFITKILSEAPTLSSACRLMIDVLKNYFDWEVIVVWVWNKEKQILTCEEIDHIANIDIDEFAKKTKLAETGKNLSFSKVWSTYRPLWIEDIVEDPTFFRRKEAIKNNLHGAFAFPFYQESQLGGVVELFRRTPFKEDVDDLLLNLVTSIGIGIGVYMQRKVAEDAKFQLSTLVTYSANGIYSTDKNGIVQTWNPSSERIYGWKASEIIGSSLKKIFPDEKLYEFDEIWQKIFSGKAIEHFQSQRMRKDGKIIWVDNAYGPITNPLGEIVGVCIVVEDITSQKTVAESLVHSEEKFKTFIEMAEEWIWEIDKDGNFSFSNQAVNNILGYKVEEILGKNILYFLSTDDAEKIERQIQANIMQKKGWVHQIMHFIHKNGSDCWLESNAAELINERGELQGFRGVSQDITNFKNLEKIKNEFISIVSHEIKTPLTSIYGSLTFLKTKELGPKEKQDLIATAQRNSERLINIINNIMDVEKLQLGEVKFDFQKINLKNVVLDSINSSQILAKKCEVKIVTEGLFADTEIYGDSTRLMQVMMNLLSNAIKFSLNQSTIHVSMENLDEVARVSIRDHGQGIPKEFEPKIFEKFAQADSSSKRAFEGTGLGLTICKSIIEGHGGTIQYRTKIGEGTTFFFEIPKFKKS